MQPGNQIGAAVPSKKGMFGATCIKFVFVQLLTTSGDVCNAVVLPVLS